MKHIIWGCLLVLLPVQLIFANTVVRSGETVTLAENQSIEGSFYVVGGTVALAGKVTGDTMVIGGNVTIGGEVTEDLAVLAGTVNIQSPVKEDVRIIAGQVTITENIDGNLVVVGGKVNISSKATIKGDVLFYGGELIVEGAIDGKLLGSSESVRVDGPVKGGIDVSVHTLTLGEQANVTGDIAYTSDREVVRAPGATISGALVKNDVTVEADNNQALRSLAIAFLVSLFATLSFYLMFRRHIETFARTVRTGVFVKTAIGFVCVFMAPLLITILLVSILGFLVGLIVLCAFALILTLALPLLAVTAGSHIAQLYSKKPTISIPDLILGAVAISLCLVIPLLGYAVFAWLYMLTVGTLIQSFYTRIR
ncbi:MAG: polymer-forming cytoskeletal protein [Patescibacteria group bacterium]